MAYSVDKFRKIHLSVAELLDAWRIVPRGLVGMYVYFMYSMIDWYMNLVPTMMEGCDINILQQACIIQAPTTQHAALITAVVGVAAAVFGLYANTGRKWEIGFQTWNPVTQTFDRKKVNPENSDN